jgi:hypothetical protein
MKTYKLQGADMLIALKKEEAELLFEILALSLLEIDFNDEVREFVAGLLESI